MDRSKVDYNQIARTFHARYDSGGLEGIGAALEQLIRKASAKKILEAGCGTGHWIEWVRNKTVAKVFGLDASTGMLGQAAQRIGPAELIAATANRLPLREDVFDVVFCVNAFHHFDDPSDFLAQAARLLVPGGTLAIIGIDPRTSRRYQYEYFEGALELDLNRYPSFGQIVDGMGKVGLSNVEMRVVDAYDVSFIGEEIYRDPFLEKPSNSLMALLTDEVYAGGLRNIAEAIAVDPLVRFRSKVDFTMITGVR
ncbi:MAG TPA: class I SAM-dependent methyltransferase [Bryobacteraceae bacterium]|nr:class I SAM-dependent methyltransferase [Bryobacteraceae bacterium]